MSMDNIKVLLVDDHAVVRMGIRSIFERHKGFTVCGEACSLSEAYDKIKELKPDVILLDWKLPDGNGDIGCINIKKILPQVKVIILTAYGEDYMVMDSIKSGADGYLLKNIDGRTILDSVKDVYSGRSVLDNSITEIVLNRVTNRSTILELSNQELQILELISLGKTNREIGKELELAEKTIRNYVSKIMKKIGVNNRTGAANYWLKHKK